MPRNLKVDRVERNDPVLTGRSCENIIIISPGSSYLHIGVAAGLIPTAIPHVIARKVTGAGRGCVCRPLRERDHEVQVAGLEKVNKLIADTRHKLGLQRAAVSVADVRAHNQTSTPTRTGNISDIQYTDISDLPEYFVGEEAVRLPPNAPYVQRWPFRYGQLDINPSYSIEAACGDLELLWKRVIEENLKVPSSSFKNYKVFLLVPDIFIQKHVKALVNLILQGLGFGAVMIHQESVCACFGTGLISGCIVDVGDQKTSICCVDESISLPQTRITLRYGSADVAEIFLWLLKRVYFPYKEFSVDDPLDRMLIEEMRQTFCHLRPDLVPGLVHEFQVRRPNSPILSYNLMLGEEAFQCALGFFDIRLFGITSSPVMTVFNQDPEHDPDDPFDDRFILELQFRDTSSMKKPKDADSFSDTGDTADIDLISEFGDFTRSKRDDTARVRAVQPLLGAGLPLDKAIALSIDGCDSMELKRRMFSTVILVGGGLNYDGADLLVRRRLQQLLPPNLQYMREQVEVIHRSKEIDPRFVSWRGAAVLCFLEGIKDFWVTRVEWDARGIAVVRERCPFAWSSNVLS